MLRIIAGVVLGMLVSWIVVFGVMTGGWLVLGHSGAFKADSWDVTPAWVAVWMTAGVAAALIAGLVAGVVSGKRSGVVALAVLMLVLGFGMAGISMLVPQNEKPARTGNEPMMEAAGAAEAPAWMNLANPIVGAVGVMIGGGAVLRKKQKMPEN